MSINPLNQYKSIPLNLRAMTLFKRSTYSNLHQIKTIWHRGWGKEFSLQVCRIILCCISLKWAPRNGSKYRRDSSGDTKTSDRSNCNWHEYQRYDLHVQLHALLAILWQLICDSSVLYVPRNVRLNFSLSTCNQAEIGIPHRRINCPTSWS